MKKMISLILVVLLMVALCACGNDNDTKGSSERNAVISEVKAEASATMAVKYAINGAPEVTTTSVKEVEEDIWEVSGKITVKDKYGDTFVATYDAVVEYDSDDKDANTVDFDYTTPRKQ